MDDIQESPAAPARRGRYFRLRRIPVPTWRVCLPLGFVALLCGWLLVSRTYGWLAIREPVAGAGRVAIEGWMPDYALKEASSWIAAGETDRVYCTGGPLDRGSIVSNYGTYAAYATEVLGRLGVPGERIVAAPAPAVSTGRTRSMAAALRRTLDAEGIPASEKRINLLTLGTHARRSREIYREELGPEWTVGVVSLRDEEVDPARWFLTSKGFKDVLSELIALTMGRLGAN